MKTLYYPKQFIKTVLQTITSAVFLFLSMHAYAEGTAQLTPTLGSDNQGVIQLWDNNDPGRNSATFGCPENKRLQFSICNREEVYFGMSFDTGDLTGGSTLWYRIVSPSGGVVFPITGNWKQVTNAGAGSIASWGQAKTGPNTIVGGTGGYTPESFTPTEVGDFYIEFYRSKNATKPTITYTLKDPTTFVPRTAAQIADVNAQQKTKVRLRYFDLTVTDAPNGNRILGRLFSKTWDINVNGGNNEFICKMYVYSTDQIVTGLDFNRIRPFGFTISCNSTGVANSGNTAADRRSIAGNSTYADYKIFLNDPDKDCYATGIFGKVLNKPTITGCDVNNRCINIIVDKAGGTELLLNFNGQEGYQFGTTDVLIKQKLVVGSNCIPWNSRDGLGNLISPGTEIDMRLDYFNGLTHLPLFDVENHPYGFIVSLVRPVGPPPLLFWDDTGIAGGTLNTSGCITQVLPTAIGCHGFGKVVAGATPASSQPTTSDWGNERTINTWWYANYIKTSAKYEVPGSIIVDANSTTTGSGASNDISSCTNAGAIQLNGFVNDGASGGAWSIASGITGKFDNFSSPITKFTPSASDLTLPFIYLYLTSTGNGICPEVKDSMKITFINGPTATPGPDQSACENNPDLTLAAQFTIAPGMIWTGGLGTFVPNNTTKNAKYTPTAAEITAQSVTLTMTTTGSTLCPEATGKVKLNYTAAPKVNAGTGTSVCVNNPTINLVGTASNQTGLTWSGGSGIFGSPGTLTTSYAPSNGEKTGNPKTITFTLTASKIGCNSVTSNVDVLIKPSPIVNAGKDKAICKNDSVNLAGLVTNATGGTWYGGTGTFSPNANALNANYKPSATELTGSSVKLILKSTGNGNCLEVTDTVLISFNPAPTALIIGPTDVCENNPNIDFKSSITNATGQLWSGNGGSFVPNNTDADVTYVPTASEISLGLTAVILKTSGGNCPPVIDTAYFSFNPAPKVDAGDPISVCENKPTGKLTGSVTGISTVTWSSPTGGLFSAPTNPITNYTATAADILAGTVTLKVTANKASCNEVSDFVVVTITPKPTVSAGPTRSVCRNNPTATFNGSVTGPTGIGVQWTTGGDGTFGTSTAINTTYTAGPNDLIAGTVTLKLTTTNNSTCDPEFSTTTMTFTPIPVVTPSNYTVCANNPVVKLNGAVTIASGGNWVGGLGTFAPGRNSLTATYTPTAAEAAGSSLVLTLESTGNGNCAVVKNNATITFTPAPTVTPVTPVNVCADAPTASISATKTVATGVVWSGGSGTILNSTNLSTTYTPTTTEVNSGSVTLTITTSGNGTCSPVSETLKIIIAPAPTVNPGSDQVVCGTVSTVSNLKGIITGATGGIWSIVTGTGAIGNVTNLTTTYTPSNQDVINGSVVLKLTTTGNGLCKAYSKNIKITYTPEPSINAGTDQIVCPAELPIKLKAVGSPAIWNTSAGTFGDVNALITTYQPTAGEIAAGSVKLTISTIASGACPLINDEIIITIPAGPIVNPGPTNQSLCGNASSYQLNGIITNATGGIWTTNGTGSFSPNANALDAKYTPSTLDRTNGSVVLTLTSTGNGFCQQVSEKITLAITPIIIVSAGPNQTLCADISGITLKGSVTNATGVNWTITSGTGALSVATDLNPVYTPSPADIVAGTVSFKIISTGNNGCPPAESTVTHTLTPAPTLNQGTDQTICGDSAFVQLNASFTIATGVNWSSNGTGTFSPNFAAANAKYIPSAADVSNGSVLLSAKTIGNGTCNAVTKTVKVTITDVVTIVIPSTANVCENNSVVNLSAVLTVANAVNWTTSGTGTFSNQTSPVTTYNPSAADIAAGIVSLNVLTTNNGTCKAKSKQVQVTIVPSPIVDAGFPQKVCATTTSIKLSGDVKNATGGVWTSNGTGTFANPNALSTTYAPTQADTTAGSVQFTLTSTGNGSCTPVSKKVLVTFTKLAIVNAGLDQTICGDSTSIKLAGSVLNSGGGIWTKSGTGVFLPIATDLDAVYSLSKTDIINGTVTLTLTSTSNGACSPVSDNMVLTITKAPLVTVSSDKIVCANNAVVNVSGTNNNVSSDVKWTTSGTGTFAPNNTTLAVSYTPSAIDKAAGNVILALSTTNNGICKPAQAFLTLTITPAPTLEAGFDKTICSDSLGVTLDEATFTVSSGILWSTKGSGVFGPNNTTTKPEYFPSGGDKVAGKVKLIAITTGNGTCLPAKDSIEITIGPIPTVNAGSDISICADTNGVKLAGSSTVAGGVLWTTTGTGIFTPSASIATANYIPSNADTTAKTVTLTLTTTNNGTCKAVKDDLALTIAPKPIVDAGSDRIVCADVDQLLLGGKVTNATGGLWSTSGSGTFSPSKSDLNPNYNPSASDLTVGTVVLTLESAGNGFCRTVSDNVTIKFNKVGSISAGNDLEVCNSVSSIDINGSATNVSNVSWTILRGNGTVSPTTNIKTTYQVNPADLIAGSVSLQLTGSAFNGCANVMDSVVIRFVASPTINAGPDKTICTTDFPIQLQGTGSTAIWSGGLGGTFSPNPQTLNATYTPGPTETGSITLTLTPTNFGVCTPIPDDVTFTLIDGPIVDAGTVPQICANSNPVNLTGAFNNVSASGVVWSTSGSGTFTNGNQLNATYTPSTSDKNGGEVILTISSNSTTNAACKIAKDTVHLHIAPAPKISTGVDQIVCGDASTVNVSSTFTNATGVKWAKGTGSGSFGNDLDQNTTYIVSTPADTTAPASITIEVSTTGQLVGCPAAKDVMTISFTKVPKVSAGSPITVCADTSSVPLVGNVSIATGGTWTSTTGGTFSPNASSLNAKYIPSALDRSTGNTTLTLTTTGNGTCKEVSRNVVITLNPKPTLISSVLFDTICSGNSISAKASVTNTGSLIWKTTGTGTFTFPTGNATDYYPSEDDISNGGVILYASTVGSNPCKEIEKYFGITILRLPVSLVNAGLDQIACADASFFPLNGTIAGFAGTGIWSSKTGRGDFYPNPTDLNPTFVADQQDITAGGLEIILTPTNTGICPAKADTMLLTILPAPKVIVGTPFPKLCVDTAYIQLAPEIQNALGGEWSSTGTGYFSPSISDLDAIYVPSDQDRTKGLIGLTLTSTGNKVCEEQTGTLTIRFSPKPTIDLGIDKIVCADEVVDLLAAITVAKGVEWSKSGSGNFTSNTNSFSNQYILSDADTTNRVFNVFAKTVNQGLCKPVFDTLKVTIRPLPLVIASADQLICADAGVVQASTKLFNATGVNWSTNGSGSFSPNSSGNPITYNISQADTAKGSVKLFASSVESGICSSRQDSLEILIIPVPIVVAGAPIICKTNLGAALNGSVYTGLTGTATWSSSGLGVFAVNNTTLNATYYPTAADITAGFVTLKLNASNYGTCKDVPSFAVLKIEAMPNANAGQDQYSCKDGTVTVSANDTQNGVSYSWSDGTTIVQPSNSKTHTFIFTANTKRILLAEDAKGCISTDTVDVTLFDLPKFNIPDVCYSKDLLVQSNPTPQPIVPGIYQWFDNSQIMTGENKPYLILPDTGNYKIQFSFANCSSTGDLKVNTVPIITSSDIIACGSGELKAEVKPTNASIVWTENGTNPKTGNTIKITSVMNDTIKYKIIAKDAFTNCPSTDSVYVIGLPIPQMVELDSTSCIGLKVELSAIPSNIANINQFLQLTYDWRKDGGAIFAKTPNVIVSDAGVYKGSISIDQCKDTSTNVIGFSQYPTSDLPERYEYCPDTDLTVSLNPGTRTNMFYLWNNKATTQINVVSPQLDSSYVVTITNQFNCSITDRTLVTVLCKPHIDVPTAFTPSLTGSGDQLFRGYGKYEQNYKLMIFNRWGEIIFVSTDKNEAWDGTYLGEPMPSGVYPWIVTYEGRAQFKGPYKQTGSVTIIR